MAPMDAGSASFALNATERSNTAKKEVASQMCRAIAQPVTFGMPLEPRKRRNESRSDFAAHASDSLGTELRAGKLGPTLGPSSGARHSLEFRGILDVEVQDLLL